MASIVIADDEPHVRTLLRLVLQSAHQIEEAEDGDMALQMVRQRLPDLVILDVAMPGLDGIEVCRALRHDPATAHIRVMVVTANGSPQDRSRAREAGAGAFVTKPFSPSVIQRMVSELLTADLIGTASGPG